MHVSLCVAARDADGPDPRIEVVDKGEEPLKSFSSVFCQMQRTAC